MKINHFWSVILVAAGLTAQSVAAQEASSPATEAAVAVEAAVAEVAEVPSSPLEDLAWLVGDWTDEDAAASIETSVNWTKNGKFLTRAFRVVPAEGEVRSGMQLIAWDPAEQVIRSWTYDSDGGFGEERWRHTDGQWAIRSSYTLPDGGRASAIHVLRIIDGDSFGWKSVSRVIDGTMQPDIDEVIVMRKAAEESVSEATEPSAVEPAHEPHADHTDATSK
jgi:hypothetical protein